MAPPSRARRLDPFREFVRPGRRRTDHPLVVGTIVLCLGITTITGIVSVGLQYALASRLSQDTLKQERRAVETTAVRAALVENMRSQASLLRRVCVNVAKSDAEREECRPLEKGVSPY